MSAARSLAAPPAVGGVPRGGAAAALAQHAARLVHEQQPMRKRPACRRRPASHRHRRLLAEHDLPARLPLGRTVDAHLARCDEGARFGLLDAEQARDLRVEADHPARAASCRRAPCWPNGSILHTPPEKRRMASCASAADCSHNGHCASGLCICNPGWNGSRCASIRWSGTGAHRAFNDSLWTWGGSPVRGPDGLIHMFASELSNDCGVLHYSSNSRVIHLTATSPLGRFTRRAVALAPRPPPAWDSGAVHGPTVHALPGGRGWALYYTGTQLNWNGTHPNCTASVDPNQGDRTTRRIGIATSASLYGPWTRRAAPIFGPGDRAAGAWDWLDVSNPTPILFANGTVLLLYKGRGHLQAPRRPRRGRLLLYLPRHPHTSTRTT